MGPSVSETNPSYKLTHSLSPDQDTTFGLYVHQRHREGHSDSNGEISGAKDSAALKRRQITILRHDPEADSRIILLPHPKVISVEHITSMSGRTVAGKEKLRAIVAPCGRRNGHPADRLPGGLLFPYRRIIGARSGVESLEGSLFGGGSGIQPIVETGVLMRLGGGGF